jgi:hypothetical protein
MFLPTGAQEFAGYPYRVVEVTRIAIQPKVTRAGPTV